MTLSSAPPPVPPPVPPRVALEPIRVAHAAEMFELLADPAIYTHLDEVPPPTLASLAELYRRRERGGPPDGSERWLNWVVRDARLGPVGYVQATVQAPDRCWIGYVFSPRFWGRGLARIATEAMLDELRREHGVVRALAMVEAGNARSIALLQRLGFRAATADEAGGSEMTATERLWVRRLVG